MFNLKTEYGTEYGCTLKKGQYYNNHVAIQIFCEDGPFATLTTNVDGIEEFPEEYSCVDTNNCLLGEDLIKRLGIGEFTGISLPSGFCIYPIYKFDLDKIKKYGM